MSQETYHNLRGSLFTGEPLEYVGTPRDTAKDVVLELCGMNPEGIGYAMVTANLCKTITGEDSAPGFSESVREQVRWALDFARAARENCDKRGEGDPVKAGKDALKKAASIASATLMAKWGAV